MGDTPDIRQIGSAARILLICPDCGTGNSELADTLRERGAYSCRGDGCGYRFNLAGARQDIGESFAEACRKFYAAFYAPRGQGLR